MQRNYNDVEGRGAPDGDRTDPLVSPGEAQERTAELRRYPGALLERVELFGAEGLSSRFLRLRVHEPGPLADLLGTLLPGLPEAASGLRDLLIIKGEAFCAALDEPAATLAELVAEGAELQRLRDYRRQVVERKGLHQEIRCPGFHCLYRFLDGAESGHHDDGGRRADRSRAL